MLEKGNKLSKLIMHYKSKIIKIIIIDRVYLKFCLENAAYNYK